MTDPNNIQRNDLIMTKPIASSAAMYSKKILDKLGGFSEQYMTILDWELIVRYVKECHVRVYYIQEELTECWQMYDAWYGSIRALPVLCLSFLRQLSVYANIVVM